MKYLSNKNSILFGIACTYGCHAIHLSIPLSISIVFPYGYGIIFLFIIAYAYSIAFLIQFIYIIPLLQYFEKREMWRAHDGVWIGVWTYIGLVYIPAILMFVIDRV